MDLQLIEKNKQEYIELLRSTNVEGIENLISWLENKSDFFTAPSSTIYHGNYPGGLCQHSLNVYYAAHRFFDTYKELAIPEKNMESITENDIIISALLHDLCKANFYTPTEKFTKDENGQWVKYFSYKIEDKFPLGHGEKSVLIAQTFIKLNGNQILAIRHHMMNSDPAVWLSNYQKPALQSAIEKCPLVLLIANSDHFASYVMEVQIDQMKDNRVI